MDEFLHLQDQKEVMLCVKEISSASCVHVFVTVSINNVLERSQQARTQTGQLHHDLVKQKVLTQEQYVQGLNEVLEFAEDMEIDIPMIWKYLGELVGPMVSDSLIPLTVISTLKCTKLALLLAMVLRDASSRLGNIKVNDLWQNSGLRWESLLPQEDVKEFISKHKVEFTACAEPRSPDAKKSLSMDEIQKALDELFVGKNADNNEVFDWIEEHVGDSRSHDPQFVRALVTAVGKSVIDGKGDTMTVQEQGLKNRNVLLLKYMDRVAELELQALYALQALVNQLQHPPGVLRTIFDTLYDEDIISEDSFFAWEASKEQKEQEGKGVATKSVVQFFTWLREADDENEQ